jgi:arylsulfatase A-like enzyme
MNLKLFSGLILLPVLTQASCTRVQKQKSEKPNVIFIMSDDHSYQTISAYDNRFIKTPNIDRLVDHGVIFRNSFVTNSISAPSRAVMLTGKFSHLNGVMDNIGVFDSASQTFPKILRKHGYQTAIIGKWHLKSIPTGFDYWNILPGQGSYYNPDFIEMGKNKVYNGYVTDLIMDFGIDWLNKRDTSKPFCLLLHNKATHRNWMPDTTDLDLFANIVFPLPDNFFDKYEGRLAASEQTLSIRTDDMDVVNDNKMIGKEGKLNTRLSDEYLKYSYSRLNKAQKARWDAHYDPIIKDFEKMNRKGKELAEWKYQRYMHDYLQCVKSVDDNIGRLLDYLQQHGLMENTLVVYTSDQGFYMGEHGWFDKRFMYEESFRTPLLMHLPDNLPKRGDINGLVQNIDYAPTFLDLAGIPVPDDMQGRSLLPLLKGLDVKDWRTSLYYRYYEYPSEHNVKRHYGIRTSQYVLMHFYKDIDEWEFFDLAKDPREMHNLYKNKVYTDTIVKLKEQLKQLQIKYLDTDTAKY